MAVLLPCHASGTVVTKVFPTFKSIKGGLYANQANRTSRQSVKAFPQFHLVTQNRVEDDFKVSVDKPAKRRTKIFAVNAICKTLLFSASHVSTP